MRSDTRRHERFLSLLKRRQVFLRQEIDADVDKTKHWVRHEHAALVWVIGLAERAIEKEQNNGADAMRTKPISDPLAKYRKDGSRHDV